VEAGFGLLRSKPMDCIVQNNTVLLTTTRIISMISESTGYFFHWKKGKKNH